MKANTKSHVNKLLAFGVILLLAAATAYVVSLSQKRQDLSIGAYQNGVQLFFDPNPTPLEVGQTQTVRIFMNTINEPNNFNVGSATVEVDFDPQYVKVNSFNIPSANPFLSNVLFQPNINNTTGIANITVTTPFSNPPQWANGTGVVVEMVIEGVQAPASGTTNLTFTPNTVVTADGVSGFVQDDNLAPGIVDFGEGGSADVPTLHFTDPVPANPQAPGTNFVVRVLASTAGQAIDGIDAVIDYIPTNLDIISIDEPSNPVFSDFIVDETANSLSISVNNGVNNPPVNPVTGDNIEIAVLTVNPLTQSTGTELAFRFTPGERNDSNMAQTSDGGDSIDILEAVENVNIVITGPSVTPTPVPSPTPTGQPTATPTPIGAPTATPTPQPSPTTPSQKSVSVKLGWQGKQRAGLNLSGIDYVLIIKDAEGDTQTLTGSTTTSDGRFTISIVPGNYTFNIKSPGYLSSTYAANITPSTNLLDYSNDPLRGGDLDASGEVNDIDHGQLIVKWLTNDSIADLDSSGQVNNLDYAVLLPNFLSQDDSI